jgi:recombination factor protein rarA
VNRPLLSRLRLLTLERLDATALVAILRRAVTDEDYGLGKKALIVTDDLLEDIGRFVDGDARMALNILEQVGAMVRTGGEITIEIVEKVLGRRVYRYDKKGNNHYDVISAFIKSMRGSDPDAVLYYLARMIEAGEDPVFIARRIIICAAEDVGLADPQALVVANAAAQAAHMVGLPEARIILSEAALYVALAPKSNSAYVGIDAAIHAVRHKEQGEVPKHLRDAHYGGAKQLGHGVGYRYAQDYPNGYVEQQYLPDALIDEQFYTPLERGCERELVKDWKDRKR